MSLEWETYTVEELVNKKMLDKPLDGNHGGIHPKSTDYVDEGVPFIMANDLKDGSIDYNNCKYISEEQSKTLKKGFSKPGDVLLTHKATIGRTAIVDSIHDTVILTPQVTYYRVLNGINNYYLYFYFNSIYFQNILKNWSSSGSTRQYIGISSQLKLPIILPPLEIQNNIADILLSIENKINPLIITDYVANGSFASLKENVSILDYEDYAYFIRNTDLKSKCFEKFVNKHSYDFLKKSSLFGNEIIISNVGDVGSVFLCPFLDKPMTLGNNMILVKSDNDAIYLNFYLFLLFRSNYGKYLISTITTGSVQSKFNKTEFKSLELIMPDDDLIIKFNKIVSPIFEYKNKISDEITNLTKLRDILLPKLMSGEIDVSKINCDL